MNKILAALCGIGILALGGVVTYIFVYKEKPVEIIEKKPPPVAPPSHLDKVIEKRVIATSFYNPAGVAVQPETGHVFVSMTDRIVRVIEGKPGAAVHDEVVGFPNETYGRGPVYEIGPLGIAFADKSTLIVGDGGAGDGADIVRIYTVGTQPLSREKLILAATDMTSFSAPILAGLESLGGEGNFYGVAVLGASVFVTCNGDDTKGWIARLELDLKKPAPLKLTPFIRSKELTNTNAPMGATITPDGKLLVCQFGSSTTRPDSLLTFYNPITGTLEKKLTTGLRDLTGIAYSPKTGKLYGVDFSWAEPAKGGLFHLDIVEGEVRAQRLASLDRPTALAFSPDGKLYVTVIGANSEKNKRTGQLLVFEGL